MSKNITVTVHTKPVDVTLECPFCKEEMKWTYKDFCNQFGEHPYWNYNKFNCENCGAELEISYADWD